MLCISVIGFVLLGCVISQGEARLQCRPGLSLMSVEYDGQWVVRCCTKPGRSPLSKICDYPDPQNYVITCRELFGVPEQSNCACGDACDGLVFRSGFRQKPKCNGTCLCSGNCCALGAPCRKNKTGVEEIQFISLD